FAPDRATVPTGPFEPDVDADATTRYLGAFVSSSIEPAAGWSLSLAGRYNRADVQIADRSGNAPALSGAHRFQRFNPAAGLSFESASGWTVFAGANQGLRAPSAIELTCADPQAPCKLPNSFLSDPPLKPVVATTVELGVRSKADAPITWSAAWYRTVSRD